MFDKFNKEYKRITESLNFKVGDKVKLKKEYAEDSEKDIEHIIKNINNKTKRAYIEAQTKDKIKPQELVGLEMIEKI